VTIFLDASVLLAACGSATGSSRALFTLAPRQGWTLMSSFYAANEVVKNLHVFPASGTAEWLRLKRLLLLADDMVTIDRPAIFMAGKDRPILFTALAHAQVLLTLDRGDFRDLLGGSFYELTILLPSDFLERERSSGRLK
jgi:predicted nucleic acid-binding protein